MDDALQLDVGLAVARAHVQRVAGLLALAGGRAHDARHGAFISECQRAIAQLAGAVDQLARAYNHTPRKCLDFKTPAEAFSDTLQLLHFKRESTSPLSRG